MEDWLNEIDDAMLDKSVAEQIERDEKFSYDEIPVGVHEVKIDNAYVYKTDNGAKMFCIDYEDKNGATLKQMECIASGDDKGNKPTYTNKDGKEIPLPGLINVKMFFKVINENIKDQKPIDETIEHFGNEKRVKVFKNLIGKKLKIVVQDEEELDNRDNSIVIKRKVKMPLTMDGKNAIGEFVEDKQKERLEKKPIKKLSKAKRKLANNSSNNETNEDDSELEW